MKKYKNTKVFFLWISDDNTRGGEYLENSYDFWKLPFKKIGAYGGFVKSQNIFQTFYVGKSLRKFRRLQRTLGGTSKLSYKEIYKNQKLKCCEETYFYMP